MYWLLNRKSELSAENKLLIYNQILKPIWRYGCPLWGCSKKSNVAVIQRIQNKILRMVVNAPWYITNLTLHEDLGVKSVQDVISDDVKKYILRLETHPNNMAIGLLDNSLEIRRLNRIKPMDLA